VADTPNIFPAIRYQDALAAIDWLTKAFGFEKHFVVPSSGGNVAHAELQLGRGMIMLGSKGDPVATQNPWDAIEQGIYVCIADVDAHYARAKAAGAEIVRPLQDTDYGAREYSVRDLEGHLWSFGTYDPYATR
jgi:uncharacterized glyoxalase superfamily protein PhnB